MEGPLEVLLLHAGELSDVAAVLAELDVEWREARAGRTVAGTAPLVIGTPAELLRFETPGDPAAVARIAICDGGGKAVESKLEAEGVDFVLRRPVHPVALRLLVLHMIYRGPERRRLRRVNASVPVRYRAGWRKRPALLLEFSVGGCRLLVGRSLPAGRRLKVFLPADLGLGRKLKLPATVVRSEPAGSGRPGDHVVAMDFGDLSPDVHQRLAAAVVARARRTVSEAPAAAPGPAPTPADALEAFGDLEERRQVPRGRYTRAVHGRVGDDQVVLMGSNLSLRGMQIDPEPRLAVGERVKLDLYGHGEIPPLRLEARVARDDGERGLYLEFENLWPGAPDLIERLVKTLPLVSPGEGRLVISEVIEGYTLR